jgi:hypothetical protein
MNDPDFVRMRENMAEFSDIKSAEKTFREAFLALRINVEDGPAANKLSQLLTRIKNVDTSSVRGKRTILMGIQTEMGQKILKTFNFNEKGYLRKVINHTYSLDSLERTFRFTGLQPKSEIFNPYGAHLAGISLFHSKVDFIHHESVTVWSEELLVPLDNDTARDLEINIPVGASGSGIDVFAIKVVFYKTIAGFNYLIDRKDYFVGQVV